MNEAELNEIEKELKEQDNRCTANPFFVVYTKREYPTSSDYYYDREFYLNLQMSEEVGESREDVYNYLKDEYDIKEIKLLALKKMYDWDFENYIEKEYNISKVYVYEIDVFVQGFFTEKSAKEYIEANAHNLRKPYVYCESLYRNNEMQAIRNHLMKNGK